MATQTEHYKFTKPLETEKVDVNVINQNMDIVDSSLKTLADEVALCAKSADISLQSLGINVSATEINHLGGVSSNIQTQLNNKASSNHGTHVNYSSIAPNANGTASAGTSDTVSRGDHVHPLQTNVTGSSGSCTGNAATATKATQDESGNVITTSYAASASLSGSNLLLKSKSGATLSTVNLSGFSNGAACSKGVSTVVAANDSNLITSGGVYTAIENSVGTVNTILNSI